MWWSRFSFLALVFVVGTTFAQEGGRRADRDAFNAGLKLGICTSQIDGDRWGGFNKIGPTGGFFVNRALSPKIEGQLEILYTNRGSRLWPSAKNGNASYRISLHYIDIPILAKFWLWKFQFEAGIINGIFFGSHESDAFGTVVFPMYPRWNRYELALGLGVNVPISEKWSINARFHRSMLPAASYKETNSLLVFLSGSYHRAVMFTLNYQFLE